MSIYISKEGSPVAFYTILSLVVIVLVMLFGTIFAYSGTTFLLAVIFGIFSLVSKNKRRKNELKKISMLFVYLTVIITIATVLYNLYNLV